MTLTNHMLLLMILLIKQICVVVFFSSIQLCVCLSDEGQSVAGKLTQRPCSKVVPFI